MRWKLIRQTPVLLRQWHVLIMSLMCRQAAQNNLIHPCNFKVFEIWLYSVKVNRTKYKRKSQWTSKWSDNVCYLLSLWFPRNTEAVPERIQTWWVRSWLLVPTLVSYWSKQQLRQMQSFQTQWRTTSHDELSKLELWINEPKEIFLFS